MGLFMLCLLFVCGQAESRNIFSTASRRLHWPPPRPFHVQSLAPKIVQRGGREKQQLSTESSPIHRLGSQQGGKVQQPIRSRLLGGFGGPGFGGKTTGGTQLANLLASKMVNNENMNKNNDSSKTAHQSHIFPMSMTPINWLPLKKQSSSAADQKPPAASTVHKSPLFSLQRRPQQQELLLFLLLLPMRFASTTALPIPPGPPISPRFLHFSLQLLPDWWSDPETRVLAVFESVDSGPKGWQMVVQLFANQPGRQMPFSTLLNISHGGHGWQRPILADLMPECEPEPADVQQQNVQLEVELSPNFLYVRAKNAAKYPLPTPLLASGDLRVFFVRLEQKKGQPERGCQLRSELDFKETSQFALPSTTPHPFAAERTTTSSSSTTTAPPTPSSSTASTTSSAIINSMTRSPSSTTDSLVDQRRNGAIAAAAAEEPSAASQLPPLKNQWPYKMKRVKVPRRSTLAAQRYLSPNHYVPQQGRNNQQGQRMFPPRTSTIGTAGWPPPPFGGQPRRTTPTPASYIDIIRDRELYEQVQRSRTMEINSQWSPISMLFMGLIAVLISLSATFALAMFILLQCRPKPKSLLIASHS